MNRSALSPIERQVREHLDSCFPGDADTRFIAGVSGGPDSMALLYIFRRLGVGVTVVHINYGKRDVESDRDQELVEQIAGRWDFPCHTVSLDPGQGEDKNFQQWARDQRYRIFRELREEYQADAIAVAHHRDDQIETILQKLFRGAGLASWRGMMVWDEPVFRPLLDVSKERLMEYVENNAVPFRMDHSNLESDFARNMLRNEWLEKLGEFFPGWKQNVLRIPEQAAIFSDALEYIGERLTDRRDRIEVESFAQLSPPLQRALILHLIKKRDPSAQLSLGALDRVDEFSSLQTGRQIELNERYSLMSDRGKLKIVYEQPDSFKIVALKKEELQERPFVLDGLVFAIEAFDNPEYDQALYLDTGKIKWPLTIRRWKAGDRFQPFGMAGHQKVSDHLTNRKIDAAEKGRALVLESFEDTICAVIFPPAVKKDRTRPGTISERARCDDGTTSCLNIKWKQNN